MRKFTLALMLGASLLASAARADQVAATIGDRKIMMSEVKEFYDATPQFKTVPFEDAYPVLLDNLIATQLVIDAAVAEKVMEKPEVKKEIEEAKMIIAGRYYMKSKVEKEITKDKLEKEYKDYIKKNKSKEEVKARHILVDTEAEAKNLIVKLDKGEKFETLANEFSKDTAAEGGELGYFTKEVMVPEFSEAAFKQKVGTYTKTPVKTQFGYHIIMVEDKRTAKEPTFKELEPRLKAQLVEASSQKVLKDLMTKAKVVRYDEKGKPMKEAAAPAKKK